MDIASKAQQITIPQNQNIKGRENISTMLNSVC